MWKLIGQYDMLYVFCIWTCIYRIGEYELAELDTIIERFVHCRSPEAAATAAISCGNLKVFKVYEEFSFEQNVVHISSRNRVTNLKCIDKQRTLKRTHQY